MLTQKQTNFGAAAVSSLVFDGGTLPLFTFVYLFGSWIVHTNKMRIYVSSDRTVYAVGKEQVYPQYKRDCPF